MSGDADVRIHWQYSRQHPNETRGVKSFPGIATESYR